MSASELIRRDFRTCGSALPIDSDSFYVYNVGIVAEVLGAFEQAVLLTVVDLDDEAYGRAILRGAQIGLMRELAAGAIYSTLDRLEQKGLLSSHLGEGTAERGGRARRYYRITAAGVRALNESRSLLERMWQGARWPIKA